MPGLPFLILGVTPPPHMGSSRISPGFSESPLSADQLLGWLTLALYIDPGSYFSLKMQVVTCLPSMGLSTAGRPGAVVHSFPNLMSLYSATKSKFVCSDAAAFADTTFQEKLELRGKKMLAVATMTIKSHCKLAQVAECKFRMMPCSSGAYPKGLGMWLPCASSVRSGFSSQCSFIHMESIPKDNEGGDEMLAPVETSEGVDPSGASETVKVKRKKLKGKRAVVRWLKHFRWKKKKEYERMTVEEKILYKLNKARNKETRLVEALKKLDPSDSTETTHDPEILTPEEHFYFLNMGLKSRNYVPIGRRGIYQGVILNMHLHWKKHQTLKVIVKTFTPEEVREIAAELARLSGGIVLDIHEEDTIIMYRGKNYVQPPTEIMSPKITLSRRKALDKSKYRDALRAVRKFIPKLEQDLQDLHDQGKGRSSESSMMSKDRPLESGTAQEASKRERLAELLMLDEKAGEDEDLSQDEVLTESDYRSESEALSDMFETDSDGESDGKEEKPLYLDVIDKLPSRKYTEVESFEEHLRKIASLSGDNDASAKKLQQLQLDEVDKVFLRAGSLLKRKRP